MVPHLSENGSRGSNKWKFSVRFSRGSFAPSRPRPVRGARGDQLPGAASGGAGGGGAAGGDDEALLAPRGCLAPGGFVG